MAYIDTEINISMLVDLQKSLSHPNESVYYRGLFILVPTKTQNKRLFLLIWCFWNISNKPNSE